ncbi:MAG: hypothetical protein LKI21_02420 [Bifidobacterium crudilactis]|jgi:hypothetical protein|nr:hypothetical protein [Bifidobacterium crudilactis]
MALSIHLIAPLLHRGQDDADDNPRTNSIGVEIRIRKKLGRPERMES